MLTSQALAWIKFSPDNNILPSVSHSVYDHIFNYSREHMLILIHLQSEERTKSQEPYGSHLQRRKRCVKFLTPLAPNKIKFTSKAGHSFGAARWGLAPAASTAWASLWAARFSKHGSEPRALPALSATSMAESTTQMPIGPVSISY